MKITLQRLTMLVMVTLLSACGSGSGDDGDIAPDTKAMLTSGTWKMKTVVADGVNKNSEFANFTISFSATGYTSGNGAPVWPASGTWVFADAAQKSVKRNDDVVVTIQSISEDQLVLSLTWSKTTLAGGRIESVAGAYLFTLTK